ncbi:LITAF-like zinc ribbon domain-containing protein [Plectosphaerella plurivora]|uniref:LITAF-like zinc ribbon domain-containing protein n=1 Tax=Plectosphaerella plurivora TaxID=936078 RepID=A0A9P9AF42_9PEZI|nr:LITAF-like zinc ribbon domain-containing protein [Plectosphaerella plurivora]
MSLPPQVQGETPLQQQQPLSQPYAAHLAQATPPPVDYYAADRASQYHHQPKPAPVAPQAPPIDYYVADRSPQAHPFSMAASPQGGPPPYQGQPPQGYPPQGHWQPMPQGTPVACLGPHPAPVSCPNCRQSGVTAVEYQSGGFTHALGALFCFVTCLGCIPYFFSGLKDATHKCANCGVPLATYHRSGRTEPHIQG